MKLKTGDRIRAKVNAIGFTKRGDTGTVLVADETLITWLNDRADVWVLIDFCRWQVAKMADQTPNPAHRSIIEEMIDNRSSIRNARQT